jgi:hypothetical protein
MLQSKWHCTSVYESTQNKSMFSSCIFAFLRIGEITINTTSRYVIKRVDVYLPQTLLFVNVNIPFSKTDQEGLSTTITITKHTQSNIFPVQLLSQFLNDPDLVQAFLKKWCVESERNVYCIHSDCSQ